MKKDSGQAMLSLRNIYRLLTVKDYPIHSDGILKGGRKKGLTLVSFWQEHLISELREGPTGRTIWRKEGGRNRYTSEICNRSLDYRIYHAYTEELLKQCQPEILLEQICVFFDFLQEREYDSEVFARKLPVFLKLLPENDSKFSPQINELLDIINAADYVTEKRSHKEKNCFYYSYMLTILTLLALMGDDMGEEYVVNTLMDRSLSFKSMWQWFLIKREGREVFLYHEKHSHLIQNILPVEHFFGRERELFDLRERIGTGGKYLFRGIGGVGKTELIRQFIKICRNEKLVNEIVLISYKDQLLSSLEKVFNIYRTNEDNEEEAVARLLQLSSDRLLVIVDGVDKTEKEDPGLSVLKTLPGTVFATGRIASLEGFERYEILPPDREAGMLIFRDNCGHILDQEELSDLEELLKDPLFCHTLTLCLLARLAGKERFHKEKVQPAGRTEKERSAALLKMYRKLYSVQGFSKDEELVLKILSLLPYRMYSRKYLGEISKNMDRLVNLGWLMSSGECVLMHPVIAESICSDAPQAGEYVDFFSNINAGLLDACKKWAGASYSENPELAWREYTLMADQDRFEDAENLIHMSARLRGKFTKEQQEAFLMAYELNSNYVSAAGDNAKCLEILQQMLKECRDRKTALRIKYNIADINGDEQLLRNCLDELCGDGCSINSETEESENKDNEIVNFYRLKMAAFLAEKGKYKESVDLLMKIHKETKSNIFLIIAEHNLDGIISAWGRDYRDFLGDLDPIEKAWERVQEEGEHFANGQFRAMLLFNLTNHRLKQGRTTEAKEAFSVFEELLEKGNIKNLYLQGYYYFLRGTMAIREQNFPEACDYLEKAKDLMGLYSQAKHVEAFFAEELAVALDKSGRPYESEKNHLYALDIFEGDHFVLEGAYRTNVNLAALYIAWDRPADALERLEKCKAYEEKEAALKNGVGHAVLLGHYAKAYNAMGEMENAVACAKEAEGLLKSFFGEEHERVREMREILEKPEV